MTQSKDGKARLKVGVCGASGYAGSELLRILAKHPCADVIFITSESQGGKKVSSFEPSLVEYQDYHYVSMQDPSIYKGVDVVFLSLPHEVSAEAAGKFLKNGIKVIDLSAAFRIRDLETFERVYKFKHPQPELLEKAVYGLPEIYREEIKKTELVANPGCYPTSVLLPLMPLLKNGVIKPELVIADSKSGFTGRGRKTDLPAVFGEMNENLYAYNIGTHRHKPEIHQELVRAYGKGLKLAFTPHIMSIDRGILSTIYIYSRENIANRVLDELEKFYRKEPFIKIYRDTLPQLKWAAHTNYNLIGAAYDAESENLVIVSVIDNLVKGAAGAAVQCMNVLFGLEETLALI